METNETPPAVKPTVAPTHAGPPKLATGLKEHVWVSYTDDGKTLSYTDDGKTLSYTDDMDGDGIPDNHGPAK